MEVGNWNQLTDFANLQTQSASIKYQAPQKSIELFCFSRHVAGWLPRGDWKIFQIDNSTSLDLDQRSMFNRLLFGSGTPTPSDPKTLLFRFASDRTTNRNTELLIANLVYLFLLFECHAYIVSSNSHAGQRLGIQDGFVYFSARNEYLSGAKILLRIFERDPLMSPDWVREIIAEGQQT